MSGGLRLLASLFWILASLRFLAAAVYAGDDAKSSAPSAPPKAEPRPVEENFHGTKIVDKYRWLEDGTTPETQKWVAEEMAYTRGMLDPLPGRDAIHKRLTELLSIGSITRAEIAGNIISTRGARACRTSPCFMCARARRKRSRLGGCEPTGRRRHHRARLVPAFGAMENIWPTARRRAARR